MAALARLVVIGFIVLTVIYLSLSLYSRAVRKSKLKAQWNVEGRTGDRDAFIREGMKEYEGSLRRKLIWGVYVIPALAITAVVGLLLYDLELTPLDESVDLKTMIRGRDLDGPYLRLQDAAFEGVVLPSVRAAEADSAAAQVPTMFEAPKGEDDPFNPSLRTLVRLK